MLQHDPCQNNQGPCNFLFFVLFMFVFFFFLIVLLCANGLNSVLLRTFLTRCPELQRDGHERYLCVQYGPLQPRSGVVGQSKTGSGMCPSVRAVSHSGELVSQQCAETWKTTR